MLSKGRVRVLVGLLFLPGIFWMRQDSWSELGPSDKRQKNPRASIVPVISLLLLADDPAPPE